MTPTPPDARRDVRRLVARLIVTAGVTSTILVGVAGAATPTKGTDAAVVSQPSTPICPWIAQARRGDVTPRALAREVLSRMSLEQKAAYVVLRREPAAGSVDQGVPSLCLPAFSMTDGPDGLGDGLRHVTQFPAELAVAASFDPAVAFAEGVAEADETRAKGIDAVQAPDLDLARVALGGRVFDTYGEDPYLASELGVAAVQGVQSQDVMAIAKHFGGYTQETSRRTLDQVITPRVEAELYDAPFRAVVERARVAGLMCSLGEINGVNTCASPASYAHLAAWGFGGFVRSDFEAVSNEYRAFQDGLSMIKPASPQGLASLVRRHALPVADLNRAVVAVLTQMFRFHLVVRPRAFTPFVVAATTAHRAVALRAAEASAVLLKNEAALLPLGPDVHSVAVIGADAATDLVTGGGGSSNVLATHVVTPLAALTKALGPRVRVTYAAGDQSTLELDKLGTPGVIGRAPLKVLSETRDVDLPSVKGPLPPDAVTATLPRRGAGWASWRLRVRARRTGTYQLNLQQLGDTWLYLDGRRVLYSPGLHVKLVTSASVHLVAGQRYLFSARWFAANRDWTPSLRIVDVTSSIDAAVRRARHARVAVVFAGLFTTEGADRANLQLPDDENALIEAVAAANPRTVVVLNTGGAVTMPWLARVASVVEAWYPGEEDGPAIAAVLDGAVDPSGRLPITFPASRSTMAASVAASFPGVDDQVDFGNLDDLGYRWYQRHDVTPLFPFGFGLDYTSFALANLRVARSANGARVALTVTNTGTRAGAEVVQVYVHDPPTTGEPPEQLRGFARVNLAPGASRRVALVLPASAFEVAASNGFVVEPGRYGVAAGTSSADLPLRGDVDFRA